MILVDTAIWVDYLRSGHNHLRELLLDSAVLMHPFVTGEIACGNLANRTEIIRLMKDLPETNVATDQETLFLIEQRQLMGRGIGYIDAHLLAATALTPPALLWTSDRRLATMASEMRLAYRM